MMQAGMLAGVLADDKRPEVFMPDLPLTIEVTYQRTALADQMAARPGFNRVGGRTVETRVDSLDELMVF